MSCLKQTITSATGESSCIILDSLAWKFGRWGSFGHTEKLTGRSERMLWHKYRQTDDGAASEVDDIVDGNHLQVQHDFFGPSNGPWQNQCGAHITGLPHVKLSPLVTRLYLEDVEGAGVACGGLHLEDICRHAAPRGQIHVSVENGEGLVPAGRVLSWAHTLVIANFDVRKVTL